MAQIDPEEQEQLEQIKSFWKRRGNFILLLLVAVMGTFFAWNQWQGRQQNQALQAAAMYDELDRAFLARDTTRAAQVFADLKSRYPQTFFAQQGALLTAKMQLDSAQLDNARASLAWVKDHATTDEYKAVAVLRLAAVLVELKKLDEAQLLLAASPSASFEGLFADRRGDILGMLDKPEQAIASYQLAWKSLDPKADYRVFVEAKLAALGVMVEQPLVAVTGVVE
jgi:predicted negative regulator of RcsB-dependent stress response